MRKRILLIAFIVSACLSSSFLHAQNFYDPYTIQDIRITFDQPNWDFQMDTAKLDSESYIIASVVEINGVSFDSVGVRYKGASSYDSSLTKNPLHLKLNYVKNNARYHGRDDIKLGNGYADPSMVREVLGYMILGSYMDAPQCNFARVFINGVYYGLYSNSESIDKNFLSDHFASTGNSFFKANPVSVISGHLPTLIYLGTDSANYLDRYELSSDYGWQDLIDFCDTLENHPSEIATVLDVDRALWMIAFNNITVNLDSYSGAFAQNYYLYNDHNDRFIPIVWDLNMCFGGFSNTGLGNLNLTSKQQMPPLLHSTDPSRPLIKNLLANSRYERMYIAHMRTINDEYINGGVYKTYANNLQALIDSSVSAETFSLYTYSQFQQSMTTDVGTSPGLQNLMDNRAAYLDTTSQFLQAPPAITSITSLPISVGLNDTIWIVTSVSNADSVFMNYRDQSTKIFNSVTMFDDGLHHDTLAGDGIYGAQMIGTSAVIQYYIYAENTNAGMFNPERAEHEFYTVHVDVPTAAPGEIVLNEFLAVNQSDTVDEAGQNEDWIEIGNRTTSPLNLFGLYLTDDITNTTKFAFPENSIIPANGYLTVWADEDDGTSSIHCNFKLAASGESIFIFDGTGNILDSVTFGVQSQDISQSRCPNDSGPFVDNPAPTYNSYNSCVTSVNEIDGNGYKAFAFPNPASKEVNIVTGNKEVLYCDLMDYNGRKLFTSIFSDAKTRFNLSALSQGIYFFLNKDRNGRVLESGRVVIAD